MLGDSPTPERASELIQKYLKQHPDGGGIGGLAKASGLSYDSVQKYAKGSNLPPAKKWELLWTIISSPPREGFSSKAGLFDGSVENKGMLTENAGVKSDPVTNADITDQIAPDLTTEEEGWTRTEDRQEIFLPVHGFAWYYPEEIEVIDHPAFQRLGGMHQLGMTNLVYRGATHRRIEHALGAVGVAQRMLDAIEHNCKRRNTPGPKDKWLLGCPPKAIEKRFVRLATLLHDIGHVPFGHTIEDELRLLNQHDGERRVDKIFNKEIWYGKKTATLSELINRLYKQFIPGSLTEKYQAADLLKSIILKSPKDQTTDQKAKQVEMEKSFAEEGLRIGICRDIVGDTICADLLDYLHRDWYHIGRPRHFDERILHYMEIRTPKGNIGMSVNGPPQPTVEDKFVISIGNRPKLRTDGISAILSLLESRYELAEAVLFHRTKMNATAMLERALSLLIPTSGQSNANEALEEWMLTNPEEVLLPAILDGKGPVDASRLTAEAKKNRDRACGLVSRLLRRDLYKSLFMITYDEFDDVDVEDIQKKYGDDEDAPQNRAAALRLLERDFDLPTGTIVMYCPESRMNKKIAEVQIFVETNVSRFVDYEEKHNYKLSGGHLQAQLNRFKSLWKIVFFIDPEIAEQKGEAFLKCLKDAIKLLVLNKYDRGDSLETLTASLARSVVSVDTFHLYNHKPLLTASPPRTARSDASVVTDFYPTGARTLLSFIDDDGHGSDSHDAG